MTHREAGALAYRQRMAFEANPHVPGGPDEAARCRLNDWPEAAREWHAGWRDEATRQADAAPQGRSLSA